MHNQRFQYRPELLHVHPQIFGGEIEEEVSYVYRF